MLMYSGDIISAISIRGRRRRTACESEVGSPRLATKNERDKLANMLKGYGYSTQDLDTFLNGPKIEWVLPSYRFNRMVSAFGRNVSYSLFDINHLIRCALGMLSCKRFRVLFGQKNQGKSQSLYFVFKLLQHCGALVVYLNPGTVVGGTVDVEAVSKWWNMIGSRLDMPTEFQRYINFPTLESLLAGLRLLYDVIGKTRPVWVIVDDVTEFTPEHPLFGFLPESDQDLSPVKWIMTGNAELGRWFYQMHIEQFVFDLPLFSVDEVKCLINKLDKKVKKSRIVDAIGISEEELVDWLMEKFAGVPGYIVEFAIAIKNGNSAAIAATQFKQSIEEILDSLPPYRVEYLQRNLPVHNWVILQCLGLSGDLPPNKRILQYILDWLQLHGDDKIRGT